MTRATLCGCLPAALGAFDFGFLALAGPRLAPALGTAGGAYPWLFSASSFAYGAAVMPAAYLSARLGPARALAAGLLVVAAGTGLLAMSNAIAMTLAARALFGLGGALSATAALTVLAGSERKSAGFAALGAAIAAGFSGGVLLASVVQWRLVLGGVAVVVLAAAIVAARGARSPDERSSGVAGSLPITTAIVLVAVAVAGAGERLAWAVIPVLAAVCLALVAARHVPALRSGRFLAACLAAAATTATGVGATILLGSALVARQWPTVLMAGFGLGVLPGTWIARRLISGAGAPGAAAAGLALQGLALASLAIVLGIRAPAGAVALVVVLFGAGHVAANAGAAAAGMAGTSATLPAALLIAAEYVGGGLGPLVIVPVADAYDAPAAILVAALVALVAAGAPLRFALEHDAISQGMEDRRTDPAWSSVRPSDSITVCLAVFGEMPIEPRGR